jgi:hypothetical protein
MLSAQVAAGVDLLVPPRPARDAPACRGLGSAGSDARLPVVETLTLARWCRTEWVAAGDVVPVAVGDKGADLLKKYLISRQFELYASGALGADSRG